MTEAWRLGQSAGDIANYKVLSPEADRRLNWDAKATNPIVIHSVKAKAYEPAVGSSNMDMHSIFKDSYWMHLSPTNSVLTYWS